MLEQDRAWLLNAEQEPKAFDRVIPGVVADPGATMAEAIGVLLVAALIGEHGALWLGCHRE